MKRWIPIFTLFVALVSPSLMAKSQAPQAWVDLRRDPRLPA